MSNMSKRRPYYSTLAGILILATIMFTGVLFFLYTKLRPVIRGRTAETQAIVTAIEEEIHTTYNKGSTGKRIDIYITLDYNVDGKPYKTRVYSGNHGDYVEGQEIIITYNVDDPSQLYLSGFAEDTVRVSYLLVGFLVVMVFILLKIDGKY